MAFLTANRKRSLTGALTGVGLGIVVFGLLDALLPEASRDGALVAAFLVPGAVVFGLTLAVAFGRFSTQAFDPLTQLEGRYLQVTSRALSNSVEQGLAFALSGAALAIAGGPAWHGTVVALALTFGIARVAFWLGYLVTTFGRAPGMAATMLLNLATVVLAVYAVIVG